MRITLLSAALLATGIASAATPVDGWYTSVFGGYTYLPDNVSINYFWYTYVTVLLLISGYNAGGRIGYKATLFDMKLNILTSMLMRDILILIS